MFTLFSTSLMKRLCDFLAPQDTLQLSTSQRKLRLKITTALRIAIIKNLPQLYERLLCSQQQHIDKPALTNIHAANLIKILANINTLLSPNTCTDHNAATLGMILNHHLPLCNLWALLTLVRNKLILQQLINYPLQAHHLIAHKICSFSELMHAIRNNSKLLATLLQHYQELYLLCITNRYSFKQLMYTIDTHVTRHHRSSQRTTDILQIVLEYVNQVLSLLNDDNLTFNELIFGDFHIDYSITLDALIQYTNCEPALLLLLLQQHENLMNLVIINRICTLAELMQFAQHNYNTLRILLSYTEELRVLINNDICTFATLAEKAQYYPKPIEKILDYSTEVSNLINKCSVCNFDELIEIMHSKPNLTINQLIEITLEFMNSSLPLSFSEFIQQTPELYTASFPVQLTYKSYFRCSRSLP
mgnify:CR=1 FL=1